MVKRQVYSVSFQRDSKVVDPNRTKMPLQEEYHSKVSTEPHSNDFDLSMFERRILEFLKLLEVSRLEVMRRKRSEVQLSR